MSKVQLAVRSRCVLYVSVQPCAVVPTMWAHCSGGVLKNPYQTVLPAAAFPYPTIDQLRPMTIFDVHCGCYRDVTFWDWVKANMPNVLSIIPH